MGPANNIQDKIKIQLYNNNITSQKKLHGIDSRSGFVADGRLKNIKIKYRYMQVFIYLTKQI